MKAILISIQPKWVEKIANGEKTIEVRKTRPKLQTPFKVYIYETQGANFNHKENKDFKQLFTRKALEQAQGKVIGEFVCDRIDEYKYRLTTYEETPYKGKYISKEELAKTCLSIGEVNDYLNGKNGYLWHITDLKIYDKPKGLSEFKKQNVCYKSGDWETLGCWEGGCVQQELGECDGRCSVLERPPQSWCYVEELSK